MKARHVFVACALFLAPMRVRAGLIVGIGNSGPPFQSTTFFTVDPLTGITTPFGQFFAAEYIASSSSPVQDTFFALSPVNVYRINPFTGERVGYLCFVAEDCTNPGADPAYDPTNQNIYALASVGGLPGLVEMVDRGLLPPGVGPPGSHRVTYVPIGNLGVTGISVIEFIPGLGLYGTDGRSAGYLIDETTGQARFLAPLTGIFMPITGLAYDSDTARLIASAGIAGGTGPGMIYQLDPISGRATLLNADAANLVGIAAVTIPEPRPVWVLIAGLLLFANAQRRRRSLPSRRNAPPAIQRADVPGSGTTVANGSAVSWETS